MYRFSRRAIPLPSFCLGIGDSSTTPVTAAPQTPYNRYMNLREKKHFKLVLLSSTAFKGALLLTKAIRHEICGSVSPAIKCYHCTLTAEKGISSLFKENQTDIP